MHKRQKKLPKYKVGVFFPGDDYKIECKDAHSHAKVYTHNTEKELHRRNFEVADDPQVFGSVRYQINSNKFKKNLTQPINTRE